MTMNGKVMLIVKENRFGAKKVKTGNFTTRKIRRLTSQENLMLVITF